MGPWESFIEEMMQGAHLEPAGKTMLLSRNWKEFSLGVRQGGGLGIRGRDGSVARDKAG